MTDTSTPFRPALKAELDAILAVLQSSGATWSRAELTAWYNDAYVELVSKAFAMKRFFIHDVPGRTAFSFTQEWEDAFVSGHFRRWTRPTQRHTTAYLWEVEHLMNLYAATAIEPATSRAATTQLWEMAHVSIDAHNRFAVAQTHNRIHGVWWDDKRLHGTSQLELDTLQTEWWSEGGQPMWWLNGVGRDGSFEVFEVATTYSQGYHNKYAAGIPRPFGIPRRWESAVRTYVIGLGNGRGLARQAISPDRQYTPQASYETGEFQQLGSARTWHTSKDSVMVLESISPRRNLTETTGPSNLPPQLFKYLRFYVLSVAFGRSGEQQNFQLAGHYRQRWTMGLMTLGKLVNQTFRARVYARDAFESTTRSHRPGRVRLPSTFQRVLD